MITKICLRQLRNAGILLVSLYPVIDDKGRIIGVFSESDLFISYLEAEKFRAEVETKS